MKKIKLINIGKETIEFEIGHKPGFAPELFKIAPGETCEVAEGYYVSTGPRKSFIERRSGGMLVPVEMAEKTEASPAKEGPEEKEELKKEEKPAPEKEMKAEPKPEPKKAKKSKK